MSERRILAVGTVAAVARRGIQATNSSSEAGSSGGARAGAIGTASEVRPRCSRMWAVTCRSVMNASTRRASPQRGHWVTSSPKTLRNRAAQSSLRASLIELAGGVIVLAGSAAVRREGTTRERQTWAEDSTP